MCILSPSVQVKLLCSPQQNVVSVPVFIPVIRGVFLLSIYDYYVFCAEPDLLPEVLVTERTARRIS